MKLFEEIGTIQTYTIQDKISNGYLLDADDRLELVTDNEYSLGQQIDVFIYFHQNNIVATTKLPEATLDTYGWGNVIEVDETKGAFVDILAEKPILVGRSDLPAFRSVWPVIGDQLLIKLKRDKVGLLYGKCISLNDIEQFVSVALEKDRNRDVLATVLRSAKVGSWAITQEGYFAFLHENERKVEPRLGEMIRARIIDVKEDGNVNISMLPRKEERLGGDAEIIYAYLLQRGGSMPYHDKSDPADIQERFSMSKAAFKRALGTLMKQGKIIQENGWTKLNESSNNL